MFKIWRTYLIIIVNVITDVKLLTGKWSGWRKEDVCHSRVRRKDTTRCCIVGRSFRPQTEGNTEARQSSFGRDPGPQMNSRLHRIRIRTYCIWSEDKRSISFKSQKF